MSSTSSGRPPAGGAVGEQVDAGGGGVLVAVLEYPCLEQAMLGGLTSPSARFEGAGLLSW